MANMGRIYFALVDRGNSVVIVVKHPASRLVPGRCWFGTRASQTKDSTVKVVTTTSLCGFALRDSDILAVPTHLHRPSTSMVRMKIYILKLSVPYEFSASVEVILT